MTCFRNVQIILQKLTMTKAFYIANEKKLLPAKTCYFLKLVLCGEINLPWKTHFCFWKKTRFRPLFFNNILRYLEKGIDILWKRLWVTSKKVICKSSLFPGSHKTSLSESLPSNLRKSFYLFTNTSTRTRRIENIVKLSL